MIELEQRAAVLIKLQLEDNAIISRLMQEYEVDRYVATQALDCAEIDLAKNKDRNIKGS